MNDDHDHLQNNYVFVDFLIFISISLLSGITNGLVLNVCGHITYTNPFNIFMNN